MKINPKNIGIMCHELAGNGKGATIGQLALQFLLEKSIQATLFVNTWPATLDDFTEIWVAGGDGTIHQFINHYPNINIPFALLGGGTGNDLKNFLYGKQASVELFEKLLAQNILAIDVGNCNGRLYVNSLGIGFDGDVLQNISSIRMIGGHLGYLLGVVKSIFTYKEKKFILRFNNEEKVAHPVILAISNSMYTGGGFVIAPKSSLQDGLLDLLYTDPLPWWKRLFVLPKVEKGKHLDLPYVYHHHVERVYIISETPVYYQIDGELLEATTFDIFIDSRKLQLNCPT
ncbi:MAG: diacylglycerol kinase family protein [Saprospiraceae bacterium]